MIEVINSHRQSVILVWMQQINASRTPITQHVVDNLRSQCHAIIIVNLPEANINEHATRIGVTVIESNSFRSLASGYINVLNRRRCNASCEVMRINISWKNCDDSQNIVATATAAQFAEITFRFASTEITSWQFINCLSRIKSFNSLPVDQVRIKNFWYFRYLRPNTR